LTQFAPDPLASFAMFCLERKNFLTGLAMRGCGEHHQLSSQAIFSLFVDTWELCFRNQEPLAGQWLTQQFADPAVPARSFAEALPELAPRTLTFKEPPRRFVWPIIFKI